jgi:hypothetical protein
MSVDLIGTLLVPKDVGAHYLSFARRLFHNELQKSTQHPLNILESRQVMQGFKAGFSQATHQFGIPSSESESRQFWSLVVRTAFQPPGVPIPAAAYSTAELELLSAALFDHYSTKEPYSVLESRDVALRRWRAKHPDVAVVAVTNSDFRIKGVLRDLGWISPEPVPMGAGATESEKGQFLIDAVISAEDNPLRQKPYPDSILMAAAPTLEAQARLGNSPSKESVMRRWIHIGDEEADRDAAAAAGCIFCPADFCFAFVN